VQVTEVLCDKHFKQHTAILPQPATKTFHVLLEKFLFGNVCLIVLAIVKHKNLKQLTKEKMKILIGLCLILAFSIASFGQQSKTKPLAEIFSATSLGE